mmetsp:Transcript_68785/g.143641  ORF Transcript_68785/g.143641 Transcript_68785/m.143641 type:complete len:569 (-) Transcript_68785:293-1999(-)|eukprot:CAMPEP_0206465226 /NCGR_PEP_ID=MMETSP0324_2-20121206/27697_1 /ASSEMBLY_ACC=CAM_ASM_000836 /TAXON_ID=2866 /ORGANISM="Crypthecodinium cohnii, Strain Seligo" /LENGTH=568 /DNA_ID=CAMNT_0053938031 /DNA_START=123 /DNA_END=1829 /DNA_ORIENTATION=+
MLPEEHSGALLLLSSSTTSEGERATADPDGDVGGGLDSHHQQQHQHCCGHRNEQEEEAHAETDEDGDLSSEGVQFCKQGGTAFSALGTSAAAASLLLAPPRTTRRRVYVVLGLCTLVAVGVIAERRRQEHLTWDRLRKPFKMYEGRPKMPRTAEQYGGMIDHREVEVWDNNHGVTHVFAVGDWGATLPDHITFATHGGSDSGTQWRVAAAMKNRARWANPPYILNVGDNFYIQGLEHSCNAPPWDNQGATTAAFSAGWQYIYGNLAHRPWLSVLGNHDYGGWRFDKGWPQQIGYSFVNHNWIMPARYYKKRMPHKGYDVDYFMIDSNAWDADWPNNRVNHNICSNHNYGGVSTCAANGGMPNIEGCRGWFWRTYKQQKRWLRHHLAKSKARWKAVVTHFPCGYDSGFYREMKRRHGLDLMVTGHRHQQELWKTTSKSNYVQSFMQTSNWHGDAPACFVTGGGGGIVSEKFSYADYGHDLAWYGFFHLTFTKDHLKIVLINDFEQEDGEWIVYPHGTKGWHRQMKVRATGNALCGSWCGDGNNPWWKVCPWGREPWISCGGCQGCKKQR